VVGRSVCVSVGNIREPCKNSWTDRDAVWGRADSGGIKVWPCTRTDANLAAFCCNAPCCEMEMSRWMCMLVRRTMSSETTITAAVSAAGADDLC